MSLPESTAVIVRPIRPNDADALLQLVKESDGLLERFDDTMECVQRFIRQSEAALVDALEPKNESNRLILLVAIDPGGTVVGCIGLDTRVGLDQPFYDFRIGRMVHASRRLKTHRCLDVLYLCNDFTGCSDVHSLYVTARMRQRGIGRQLAMAAQLFIAAHRIWFAPRVITELRGVTDENGRSPFWEAVGRHFFRVDQRRAERLVAQGKKSFIAELMPKFPVYACLLPQDAQSAIGQVNARLNGMLPMLESDGFRFGDHIDIFDGGRVLEAHTDDLAGPARSAVTTAAVLPAGTESATTNVTPSWISTGRHDHFRMIYAPVTEDGDRSRISALTAARMQIESGALLRVLAQ